MSEPEPSHLAKTNRWKLPMIISFVFAAASPLIGLAGTVFGMMGAFDELAEDSGAAPSALAQNIGTSLQTTVIGIGGLAVGLILGLIFLGLFISQKKRAEISYS